MKRMLFVVLMEIAIISFFSCSGHGDENLIGSGTIEATEITISSKLAGEIIFLAIEEGQSVTAGQLLAVVDTEKVALQKQQLLAGLDELRLNMISAKRSAALAQTNLLNVEKRYKRIKALHDENSATQQQLDDVTAALDAARTKFENAQTGLKVLRAKRKQLEAQLGLLQSQLKDAKILAPVDGTILEKYIERSEIVRPGGPIATVANLAKMKMKVYVPETDLGRIKLGEVVGVKIDTYPDKALKGKVVWISPRAEFTPKNVQTREARTDLVYAVKISLKNQDGILKIGMPADVYYSNP